AELLSRRVRRPHDPAAGAAPNGPARGSRSGRNRRQPRRLCFEAGGGRQADRASRIGARRIAPSLPGERGMSVPPSPSFRKLAGVALILLLILLWAGFVAR